MRDLNFRVYCRQLLQELKELNYARHFAFCEWYLIISASDPDFSDSILWIDEAIFKMNGHVNRYNCVYWSDTNPHLILQKELNSPGVMVWAGVNVRGFIGPYFFDTNVNANSCLELLEQLRVTLNEDKRFAVHRNHLTARWCSCSLLVAGSSVLERQFPRLDWQTWAHNLSSTLTGPHSNEFLHLGFGEGLGILA